MATFYRNLILACLLAGGLTVSEAGLAKTVTVTMPGTVNEINAGSIMVSGAAPVLPEAVATNSNSANAVITTAIVTATNNALLIDTVGSGNGGNFTPGGGQAEQWDTSFTSATGAMSTKTVAVAGPDSMTQTHSTISNRMAHAVISAPPVNPATPVTVESSNFNSNINVATLSWAQAAPVGPDAKIFVGIAIEEPTCPAQETVSSVTFGTLSLTRVATVTIVTTFCMHVEIWAADVVVVPAQSVVVNLPATVNEINAGSIVVTGAATGFPEAVGTNPNSGTSVITTAIATATDNALLVDTVGSGNGGSFTASFPQAEQWDESFASGTGAMSTKTVAVAGADSMTQTHSTVSNRMAHAVIAVTPDDPATPVTVNSSNSNNDGGVNTLNWVQTLPVATETAKIFVGIAIEHPTCTVPVTSVSYGNLNLTRVATVSVFTTFCQHVEIWYADLPNIILSTQGNSILGGVGIDQDEANQYDAVQDSGTLLLFDGPPAPTIFTNDADIDALHLLASGNFVLSTRANETLFNGGAPIPMLDGDLVEIQPDGTFVQFLFNEATFNSGNEDIDAVFVRDNGNIVLSTTGNANLGTPGLGFNDDDIIEYDPVADTATLLLDGATIITNVGGDEDIDAVRLLDDDSILFSLTQNRTVAGVAFLDGDIILFDPATGTASLFLGESAFTSGNEDVNSITPGPRYRGRAGSRSLRHYLRGAGQHLSIERDHYRSER